MEKFESLKRVNEFLESGDISMLIPNYLFQIEVFVVQIITLGLLIYIAIKVTDVRKN